MNEFTWPFHEIVVTYGTPDYKEVNPTTFNMATYPFLFGIMFGDIGHGALLFALAIYLCLKKDYLLVHHKELFYLLKIRYLLLLMGFYALFCGLIYNDMMSLPLNLFGSCYESVEGSTEVIYKEDCVYPFGIDPKWYLSSRELNFLNSFKMKLSVLLGVA
jgi:V-type H+-transporting ATPase subunit a